MLNPVLDLAQQILFRTRDAPSVGEEVGMEDSMQGIGVADKEPLEDVGVDSSGEPTLDYYLAEIRRLNACIREDDAAIRKLAAETAALREQSRGYAAVATETIQRIQARMAKW